MSQRQMEKIAYQNGHILKLEDIVSILKIPVTETYLKGIGYGPDYSEYGKPEASWWYEFRLPVVTMGIAKAILRESYTNKERRSNSGISKEKSCN